MRSLHFLLMMVSINHLVYNFKKKKNYKLIRKFLINPFYANTQFLNPLKTFGFWSFQGI